MPDLQRISNRLSALIVVLAMLIPGLGTPLLAKKSAEAIQRRERRTPAKLGTWTGLATLVRPEYFTSVSDWLSDRLAFRTQFVTFKHTVDAKLLHHEQVGEVHIGRDDWLFFDRSVNGGFRYPDLVDQALERLEAFLDASSSRHGKVLFVVAPDKLSIYPDKLSEHAAKIVAEQAESRRRFEQFFQDRDGHGTIDLWSRHRRAIAESGRDTYWSQDTHHNPRGQVLMARAMVEYFAPDAWWPEAVQPAPEPGRRLGDLARLANIAYPEMVFENFLPPTADRRIDKDTPELFGIRATRYRVTTRERPLVPGRTLLLHDSFCVEMRWLIPWFFEDITMVNINYASVRSGEFLAACDTYDNIIVEVVERNAPGFLAKLLSPDADEVNRGFAVGDP